jgi:hypothetical protein
MDGDQFDRLTRILATGVPRRRLLRSVTGGIGAAVLAALGRRPAATAPNACAQACAFEPKGPRQAACRQACRECGGNINLVCSGPQIICCPEGGCCIDEETGTSICPSDLPECPEGLTRIGCECVEVTFCPTGEMAENCFAGIFTNCGEGDVCALVDDADSESCACIERICGNPCTTAADCEAGLVCATVPGCCPDETFCAFPCGTAASAPANSAAWGK